MRDSLMNTPNKRGTPARMLGGALVAALIAGGCASHRHCPPPPEVPEKPVGFPCGPCAGYYPTCWRPWPDVCPSCPVFGLEEPTPTELPMETVPVPPSSSEITTPGAAQESPESEALPGDAEPSLPAEPQSRAPMIRPGMPSSRRVVGQLPEWQMPPLPESPQAGVWQPSFGADEEERPVRTPSVVPAGHLSEPILNQAAR